MPQVWNAKPLLHYRKGSRVLCDILPLTLERRWTDDLLQEDENEEYRDLHRWRIVAQPKPQFTRGGLESQTG
ncbi:hypothetical protein FGO68_gene3913 [Halteria grandinella]|uniref:Uncharacterized protein n=1 Tax=Halteria grandinella TaxID=5974 RepID=A0A8J8STY3_HALGN|nr:hypothetical protein FGO68_gene3913 [Halteria grandinella]